MTSMKSRQMGVVWLFVMYLAMMWLFLWNFSLAFTVFSITWCLCFLLQSYLPEMPYPTLDKTTLNPPRFASVPFFIFFSAPAIVVAGGYQVGLFFDHDYMELYWPIDRLLPENGADFFHYRDWRDEYRKSGYMYDSIYLLIDYLDVCFFAFLFFLAHWFLGSVGFISQVDERYGPLGKSFLVFLLRGLFASLVMFFIVFFVLYLVVGMNSDSGGYSAKISEIYSNRIFVFGIVVFMSWVLFLVAWGVVNNFLLCILRFISPRTKAKDG